MSERKATLHTENGIIEVDPAVENYIHQINTELRVVTAERNRLSLKLFEMEFSDDKIYSKMNAIRFFNWKSFFYLF